MAERIVLTKKAIAAIKAPETGRTFVFDTKVQSLAVQVTPTGAKSFYLVKRFGGKPVRYFLGQFPGMSVEQARKDAEVELAKRQLQQPKRTSEEDATFEDFYQRHLKMNAPKISPYSAWRIKQVYELHIREPLGKVLVHDITPELIMAIVEQILEGADKNRGDGKGAVNMVLSNISAIFNKNIELGFFTGVNPCKNVPRFKYIPRIRVASPKELETLYKVLEEYKDQTFADFIRLSLLIGTRRENTRQIRWADIDWGSGNSPALLRIEETKGGGAQVVPLPPAAVELLQKRKAVAKGAAVFHSPKDPDKAFTNVHLQWKAVREKAGLPDLYIHDLRRTFGSMLGAMDVPLQHIQEALNHKNIKTTLIYVKTNKKSVYSGMEKGAKVFSEIEQRSRS